MLDTNKYLNAWRTRPKKEDMSSKSRTSGHPDVTFSCQNIFNFNKITDLRICHTTLKGKHPLHHASLWDGFLNLQLSSGLPSNKSLSIGAKRGPGSSSGKAFGCGLDGPGSIQSVGGVEIYLRSFMSRLVLGSTQPPIK